MPAQDHYDAIVIGAGQAGVPLLAREDDVAYAVAEMVRRLTEAKNAVNVYVEVSDDA